MPSKEYLDFCEDSTALHEAGFLAQDWHSGQWSALYMLSCFAYEHWAIEDIEGMILELDDSQIRAYDDIDDILEALETAKRLLEK